MKRLPAVLAVAAAALIPALSPAAPALASARAPANTVQRTVSTWDLVYQLHHVGVSGGQFSVSGSHTEVFNAISEGTVGGGYPFADGRFNTLYASDPVFEMQQSDSPGGCAGIDSAFHSGVVDSGCANGGRSLWVGVGRWFVSVGFTDHQDNYPYGSVMFRNSNFLIYCYNHQPANNDVNQWGFTT